MLLLWYMYELSEEVEWSTQAIVQLGSTRIRGKSKKNPVYCIPKENISGFWYFFFNFVWYIPQFKECKIFFEW